MTGLFSRNQALIPIKTPLALVQMQTFEISCRLGPAWRLDLRARLVRAGAGTRWVRANRSCSPAAGCQILSERSYAPGPHRHISSISSPKSLKRSCPPGPYRGVVGPFDVFAAHLRIRRVSGFRTRFSKLRGAFLRSRLTSRAIKRKQSSGQ